MPRATHPGPAALRNRNRVTNKTRLKVIKDTIEADSIVLDEDEEKARVVSTAGVDAEDANEHHLQAVLSAAASRHQATRATRSGDKDKESVPAAYIPTPDSTGVVLNYEELYPPGRWKDPHTYVKSSDTVEEATSFALANGFIYYMDERDKEWLDKNNEQARGEGMSSQTATSSSTRSGRSAKAKGKEPDVVQAVSMTEDEFELVMAIFEKVTHEKTEFLHHGLEQGAPFPPFSDYHDTFASPLQPDLFAVYSVPSWVPTAQQLLRYARVVYPYWRERRQERGGHRIIPIVNLDESDTKNESYICFRRREIKAVRKTRASQTSYSDRMVRLQNELATALEMVNLVQKRENVKREASLQNRLVWDRRRAFADLKRAHPSLGTKEDDELFLDKEKPPKKVKVDTSRPSLKLRHPRDQGETGSPVSQPVPQIRPRERLAAIQAQVDQELQRCKERDKSWEDASDYPYQASPVSYGCRLFKEIPPRPAPVSSADDDTPKIKYQVRLRTGRGGRRLDRRRVDCRLRAASFGDDDEAKERARRLEERFRYDDDDGFLVGSGGMDEQDRRLVDDCQPKHLTISMSIFQNEDYQALMTDTILRLPTGDYRPYNPGPTSITQMRPVHPQPQHTPTPSTASLTPSQSTSGLPNGTPVSVPTPMKRLQQPNSLANLRISSGGGLRVMSTGSQHPASPHATPPSSASASGFADAQGSPTKATDQDLKPPPQGSPRLPVQADTSSIVMTSPSPAPSKPVPSAPNVAVPNISNGYHISAVNGYPPISKAGYMHSNSRHNGLSLQQMQQLQAMMPDSNVNIALRQQGAYVMPNGAYPMQIPSGRPMQWPLTGQHSPPNSRPDAVNVDGSATSVTAGSPGRTPSANSLRAAQIARSAGGLPNASQVLAPSPAGQHIARLAAPHSPSPHLLSPNMAAAQANVHASPTRAPQPVIPTPSPSLQSRQLVGGSGAAGY